MICIKNQLTRFYMIRVFTKNYFWTDYNFNLWICNNGIEICRSSFYITCLYDVSIRSLLYPNSFRCPIIYHWSMGCQCTSQWWCYTEPLSKRVKLFKNGPSKICGRRPLRCLKSDMVCREIIYHLNFFKGFLPQILLSPF